MHKDGQQKISGLNSLYGFCLKNQKPNISQPGQVILEPVVLINKYTDQKVDLLIGNRRADGMG